VRRRLAAILAADVVGYSKAMAEDEAGTLARLKAHRAELFDPKVAEHNGRIIKLMGDGTLVEFASVVDAVECALAIQMALATGDGALRLRIGINLGDVIIDGDDVYGDGVNVAARLEAHCQAGGVCISDMVYQNIEGKLDAAFVDLGTQNLKNIARPISLWQWSGAGPKQAKTGDSGGLTLPERPSIAVLPFDNMSGDPDQEYFSDGITEDLITELSRFRELFVIARNSSFSYKGKSLKVQDIGRDLGVAYIVEGSVRKAGNRVRITAQLIEAASGNHIWAERYDRELQDIFDLQDEITQTIVTLLPVRLQGALVETLRRKPSQNLSAYDCFLHGRWLYDRSSGQDPLALERLRQAVEIDPGCAAAQAYIALAHAYSLYTVNPIGTDPTPAALQSIERALAAGEGDHFVHAAAGYVYILSGWHDLAEAHSGKAVALNRNDIFAMLGRGYVLAYLGDPAAGVDLLNRALRYDPHTPAYFHEQFAEANYMLRDYEKAIAIYKRWQSPPLHMYILLAVNCAQLGLMEEARAAKKTFDDHCPDNADFTFHTAAHLRMCKRSEDAEHWLEGYRKVGLAV
jgi:TolB-like protein/class 3 adenylate cyclase